MLLKNILFLGLAVFTAASPTLDARAGTTGKAVGGTGTGTKGKAGAQCPAPNAFTGTVTCPRVKFTAAQINKAVKQAKAMKVKGKTGKGLHFPAKYKPAKETKAKGAKAAGGKKGGKVVKRDEEEEEETEEVHHVLEARRGRGGASKTKTRTKPARKTTPKKTTPKKTPKKTTPTKKPTKCPTNGKAAKVGKGVWMFPILEKGVWKREYSPYTTTLPVHTNLWCSRCDARGQLRHSGQQVQLRQDGGARAWLG